MINNLCINTENIFENFEKLIYGINTVYFENDEAKDMMTGCIEATNIIFKTEIVSILPSEIDENEPSEEVLFDVVWKSREESPVLLTIDDISIEHNARTAKDFELQNVFCINEKLLKHAAKMASKHGVKFKGGKTQYFDGRAKEKSVASQMEEALQQDRSEITFTIDQASPQTVRVYASTLSNYSGRKIRVSVEPGIIRVIFKEATPAEKAILELERIWKQTAAEIGTEATADVFRDIVAKYAGGLETETIELNQNQTMHQVLNLNPSEERTEPEPDNASEVIPLVLDEESKQYFIPGTEPVSEATADENTLPEDEEDEF